MGAVPTRRYGVNIAQPLPFRRFPVRADRCATDESTIPLPKPGEQLRWRNDCLDTRWLGSWASSTRAWALEACDGAHHWARMLRGMGHDARWMSPQLVRSYVKSNKNDLRDAEALCEAVCTGEVGRAAGLAALAPGAQSSGGSARQCISLTFLPNRNKELRSKLIHYPQRTVLTTSARLSARIRDRGCQGARASSPVLAGSARRHGPRTQWLDAGDAVRAG